MSPDWHRLQKQSRSHRRPRCLLLYPRVRSFSLTHRHTHTLSLSLFSLSRTGLTARKEALWEGYRESRRCFRDTYLESYITKYTSIRRLIMSPDWHRVEGAKGGARDSHVHPPRASRCRLLPSVYIGYEFRQIGRDRRGRERGGVCHWERVRPAASRCRLLPRV